MKKIILSLLLLLSPIFCFAQINRTFWGTTLGKSSKQQVRNALVQKGFRVKTDPDESLYVNVNNVNFGGAVWTYVAFSFVNGILSQVWFQNNENQSPIKLNDSYDKIKRNLDIKYKKLLLPLPSDKQIIKQCYYTDGITDILLSIRLYNNLRYISLSYEDLGLHKEKSKNELDEL